MFIDGYLCLWYDDFFVRDRSKMLGNMVSQTQEVMRDHTRFRRLLRENENFYKFVADEFYNWILECLLHNILLRFSPKMATYELVETWLLFPLISSQTQFFIRCSTDKRHFYFVSFMTLYRYPVIMRVDEQTRIPSPNSKKWEFVRREYRLLYVEKILSIKEFSAFANWISAISFTNIYCKLFS